MKKASRKLQLNRETLITMQNDDLDGVFGGATPSTVTTTVPIASAASRASSAACLRAASELAKHTAKSVASVASAISYSVRTVFGSRGCGPTQGGQPAQDNGGNGGEG